MDKHTEMQVIDWELGTQIMGNDLAAAKSMMEMLVKELPNSWRKISFAYQSKNLEEARQLTHGLHGAVCYCGTPRLKEAIKQFEHGVRHTQADGIEKLYERVEKEIGAVLEEYEKQQSK